MAKLTVAQLEQKVKDLTLHIEALELNTTLKDSEIEELELNSTLKDSEIEELKITIVELKQPPKETCCGGNSNDSLKGIRLVASGWQYQDKVFKTVSEAQKYKTEID